MTLCHLTMPQQGVHAKMPKTTFFNLKDDKKAQIVQSLIKEFEAKTMSEATVKDIVEALEIPRGSFYQYFFSLEEAYFYILDLKFDFIHREFLKIYTAKSNNLRQALLEYGQFLAKEIYKPENYKLFRNRYLTWNARLERDRQAYLAQFPRNEEYLKLMSDKKLSIIGALVHHLIQKLFNNEWGKATFLKEYEELVNFIMGGINYV